MIVIIDGGEMNSELQVTSVMSESSVPGWKMGGGSETGLHVICERSSQ